jgi:hypothetical protein
MKPIISNEYQSVMYRTSKRTILLVPYGFRNLRDNAATCAAVISKPIRERQKSTGVGGSYNAAKEGPEQCLWREVIGDLFQTEQNTSYRCPKGDGNAARCGGTQCFSPLHIILMVFREEPAANIAHTSGNVDKGAFLSNGQAGRHAQNKCS